MNDFTDLDLEFPLLPLVGAEGDDDGGDGGDGDDGGDGSGTGGGDSGSDDGLTEGGRKAIEAERASSKRARDAYKPWAAIKRDFGLSPEQVREKLSGAKTSDQDAETARREAFAEATKKANARIVRAEVKALAADSFQDPSDAFLFVNVDEIDVDDDGEVDTAAISKALKDALTAKPYLGKAKKNNGQQYDGGTRTPPPPATGMNGFIRTARRSGQPTA